MLRSIKILSSCNPSLFLISRQIRSKMRVGIASKWKVHSVDHDVSDNQKTR